MNLWTILYHVTSVLQVRFGQQPVQLQLRCIGGVFREDLVLDRVE